MTAILPSSEAETYCSQLMHDLDNSELGRKLMQPNCGRMFGVLVCSDGSVYRAFSGELLGSFTYEGFVPPVFDPTKVQHLLEEADSEIKATEDNHIRSEISRHYWDLIKKEYIFHCRDGQSKSLDEICPNSQAGTGDCCAPRLLNACYKDGKTPRSLAEFYYGNGTLNHKEYYTPCDERCKPILKHIIGLDIIYLDSDIVVVNKPSGVLAIEGKGPDKQDCIASRVRVLLNSIQQPCIHRLDQATSGLMVLGLTQKAHDILSNDFEDHRVYKEYEAVVEGKIIENSGTINLPMRLDTDNRPHQIVDFENGKEAETYWEKLAIKKLEGRYVTKLRLIPKTGRTHQLRLHCAQGLGHPIVNDSLYGTNPNNKALMLNANVLSFTHPTSKERLTFSI